MKMVFFSVVVFLSFVFQWSPRVYGQGSDEPLWDFESRVHRIYQKYGRRVISPEQWQEMAQSREMETYQVQSGDTLWGLSRIYFGSGYYWSKIWSLNGGITNPHQILPQRVIQFYPGTLDQEPSVQLAQGQDVSRLKASSQGSPGGLQKSQEKASQMIQKKILENPEVQKLIPPAKKRRPVLGNLPSSLPRALVRQRFGQEVVQLGESLARPAAKPAFTYQLHSYIVDKDQVESTGRIVEMELGGKTAGPGRYVYVKADNGQIGQEYTVVYSVGEIEGAHIIEVQGRVRLLQIANRDGNLYRAIVTYSLAPIFQGADLVAEPIETYNMRPQGSLVSTVSGTILGGPFDSRRQIFGRGEIVFVRLDGGSSVGEGSVIPVMLNQKTRNLNTAVNLVVKQIGLLKVLRVSGDFLTAVVIRSSEEIYTGDTVGDTDGMIGEEMVGGDDDSSYEDLSDEEAFTEEDVEGDGDSEEEFDDSFEEELEDSPEEAVEEEETGEELSDEEGEDWEELLE